jgi:hypothetical protein
MVYVGFEDTGVATETAILGTLLLLGFEPLFSVHQSRITITILAELSRFKGCVKNKTYIVNPGNTI